MRKIRLYLLVILCLIFTKSVLYSQVNKCITDELLQNKIMTDPSAIDRLDNMDQQINTYLNPKNSDIPKSNANLTIPVVVYIVHGNGPENISDTQVMSQINALNGYFANYGVNFCLATKDNGTPLSGTPTPGIIRVYNPFATNHNANTGQAALKGSSTLSNERYLRIWVVKSINGGTANGYSMLPDVAPDAYDGIVMAYNAFGDIATCACTTLAPTSKDGKILVHEVGHYLGLYHTFHGGCSGMNSNTCSIEGDRVCDTPPVSAPNSGCPSPGWNTCFETPDLPDNVNNYMDYTNESCLNSFTDGQTNRMHAAISLYRSTLVSINNHNYTDITCNGGLLPGFTASNYAPCVGTSVTFTAATVPGATYSWEFGDGTTATGLVASHIYTAAYDPAAVVLTVTNFTGSASIIKNVHVTACTPIASSQGNWYFYNKNGLSFASGAPVYDNAAFANNTFGTAAQGVNELSAVQSDNDGNLLFYTDGKKVWNGSHNLITSGLNGHYSSMMGVLIVPDPANENKYYIFTSDARRSNGKGFNYSKVDMTSGTAVMSGPLNVPITAPAIHGFNTAPVTNALITGEGLTAVASPNGYWILAETVKNGDKAHAVVYSLTANGLTFHQKTFISTLQAPLANNQFDPINIKASPNGKRVVIALANWLNEIDYVFDFHPCSGQLSNKRTIPLSTKNCSGWAFAANSNLLYGARNGNVFQYNLESCEIEVITVCDIPTKVITHLQMGPDGKIYGSVWQGNQLITIHKPSNLSTTSNPNACMFDENGPIMENGTLMSGGIPNMIAATEMSVFSNQITYTLASCSNVCYTYNFNGDLCATTYAWNFGDPASGSANTSNIPNPTHTFSGPGTYNITLIADGITVTTTVQVGVIPDIIGSLTICPSTSMTGNYSIDLESGYSVTWSAIGGTIVGMNNQADVTVQWTSLPGTLKLILTNNVTSCQSSKTIQIIESCESCVCNLKPSIVPYKIPDCTFGFNGYSGADECMQITEWKWTFNDGGPVIFEYGQNVTHQFPANGTYEVCLQVSGTNGSSECVSTVCEQITVECMKDCPCEIDPDFVVELDPKSCIYTFYEKSEVPSCQQYVEYHWDFGDGFTTQGPVVDHSYDQSGTYEVCLKVIIRDKKGEILCEKKYCETLEVNCISDYGCSLDPYYIITYNGDCQYTLTGFSGAYNTTVSSYSWLVNGSSVSNSQILNISFNLNTTYEVCLVVEGYVRDEKCSKKYCKDFYFKECPPMLQALKGNNPIVESAVEMYPNPAQNKTALTFTLDQDGPVLVTLRSSDGRMLAEWKDDMSAGQQTIQIPLSNLPTGVIFVEMFFDNQRIVKRLVILK